MNRQVNKGFQFFFLFFFFLPACHSAAERTRFPAQVNKGSVTVMHCIGSPMEEYVVYVPVACDTGLFPVLVFFDSHGKGREPVTHYRSLAEKYGVILAGSNRIKNGLPMMDVMSSFRDVLQDLKCRFPVDTHRIFLAGFSGGARMASLAAVYQQGIAGVIACGAGMDPSLLSSAPAFAFTGIAGLQDMNYSELMALKDKMKSCRIPNQFLVFEGKHEWPPVNTMEDGLLFVLLKNHRRLSLCEKDQLIQMADVRLRQAIDSVAGKDLLQWLRKEQNYVNYLKELKDVTLHISRVDSLLRLAEVQKAIREEQLLLQREEAYKKKLQEAFINQPEEWWDNETRRLKENIRTLPPAESLMYQRILAYASLLSYSYVNHAFSSRNPHAALQGLRIYHRVDPGNPDCAYFYACYYAWQKNYPEMMNALREAIDKGFNDRDKIVHEPFFVPYSQDKEFNQLLQQLAK